MNNLFQSALLAAECSWIKGLPFSQIHSMAQQSSFASVQEIDDQGDSPFNQSWNGQWRTHV